MEASTPNLLVRTRDFSVRIVRLFAALPKSTEAQVIGKQLLRSGTSLGAHLREAYRGRSHAEMLSKIEGGLQELEETRYWFELLEHTGIVPRQRLEGIANEARELTAILVTSARRLKVLKSSNPR